MPDMYELYNKGLKGAVYDEQKAKEFLSSLPHPFFKDVNTLFGDGKGKLSLPFKAVQKFWPTFGVDEAQTTGDCFIAGTKVKMDTGHLKNIEDVKVGERVVTHNNRFKRVESLVKKYPSNSKINDIYIKQYNLQLSMTDDHKVIVYTEYGYDWVETKDLKVGDFLVIPKGHNKYTIPIIDMLDYAPDIAMYDNNTVRNKNSKFNITRFINWSSDLMWLFGIYAAEGGVDGNNGQRITFNLSIKEGNIADRIQQLFKSIFNAKTTLLERLDKNVLCVRCSNVIVAQLFKNMVSGNQWSKSISTEVQCKPQYLLESFVRGWVDGDGHTILDRRRKITGVSVSKSLIKDVSSILMQLQIQHTVATRKPRNRSKESYEINIYGDQVYKLYPELKCSTVSVQQKKQNRLTCSMGLLAPISRIETRTYTDYVYCINVEDDHSFIANNIAVHNCVSHSWRNVADINRAFEIVYNGEKESFVNRSATEGIYGSRGSGGEGMFGHQGAEFLTKTGGVLVRQNYPEAGIDLSKYNGRLGAGWGRSGVPSKLLAIAKKNQFKTASLVKNVEEARDLIANGYALSVCSNYGFSNKRDKHGISEPSGTWYHAMSVIGCDDTKERLKEILFLIQNSWGEWNSGPLWNQPGGSFWIREKVMAAMLDQDQTYALSEFDGFKRRMDWSRIREIYR